MKNDLFNEKVAKRVVGRFLHGPHANYYPTIMEIATEVREVMQEGMRYPSVPTTLELCNFLSNDKPKLRAITRKMSERRGRMSHLLTSVVWKEMKVASEDPAAELLDRKDAYRLFCGEWQF
jgi:hypothetical protein